METEKKIISNTKKPFLAAIHLASPAIITGVRNIAFESGIVVANAPASYLNLLDCCESDEAISSRITLSQTRCNACMLWSLPALCNV